MNTEDTSLFIDLLCKTGLSENEAIVYFYLIQHGKEGSYVNDLRTHSKLERTTIYSILNRLMEYKCVKEKSESNAPKKAKMFIATSPELYFNRVIDQKREEIKQLEHSITNLGEKLEMMYLESKVLPIGEIDSFFAPYLTPLIENGWKVIDYVIEKSKITHDFEAYDSTLFIPEAKIVKDAGFLIFKYDRNIENDVNLLNYMKGMLKRRGKEEIVSKGINVTSIEFSDAEIEINGQKYPGFKPKFRFKGEKSFKQLTEAIILPIKDKIFFIWAENHKFILKMIEVIFRQEKT